jgi:hypothetical protein
MFTKRQTVILRMLLSYGLSNLDDIRASYSPIGTRGFVKEALQEGVVDYNGEIIPEPTENEIEKILKLLQG